MSKESDKLKLGKGQSLFVKSQLCRLRQQDDTWEADFFPIPSAEGTRETVWMGLVLSHTHDKILAQSLVQELPTVNDLAHLLAEAMRRPLVELCHRPRTLYLRAKSEWAELLPHLKQVGIQVVSQENLPKWNEAFGDLRNRPVKPVGGLPGSGSTCNRGSSALRVRCSVHAFSPSGGVAARKESLGLRTSGSGRAELTSRCH